MAKQSASAFFSYSRQDTEFAQRLAQDLRASGASVWLDQLDIRPGQRWDRTVQDALANCPRMLVVLSPSSVDSENVMDEVSFALERKKTVIPVLYRDCDIPFRLGRVQYIDFRVGYEKALKELVENLKDLEAEQERQELERAEATDQERQARKQAEQEPPRAAAEREEHEAAESERKVREKAAQEQTARAQREWERAKLGPATVPEARRKRAVRSAALVVASFVVVGLVLLWASSKKEVGVKVTPENLTLQAGGTANFNAQVTGARETGVTWSLDGEGSLSPDSGVYVAPSEVRGPATVSIKATSKADPTKYGIATITLNPATYSNKVEPLQPLPKKSQNQQTSSQTRAEMYPGAKQRAPSDQTKNGPAATAATYSKDASAGQLQLEAQATPISGSEQANKRYRFSLSVRMVNNSANAAPNPLSD